MRSAAVNVDALAPRARGLLRTAARAWKWWTGELRELLPARFTAEDGSVIALVAEPSGLAWQELAPGRSPLDAPLAGKRPSGERAKSVDLIVDEALVLDLQITLPVAAEPNLRAIIGNMTGSLVPITPGAFVFDFAVERRDPVDERLRVAVAVIKAPLAASIEEALGSMRPKLRRTVIRRANGADARFDLLRGVSGVAFFGRTQWPKRLLEISALGLFLLATGLQVLRNHRAESLYDREISSLSARSDGLTRQRQDLQAAAVPIEFLARRLGGPQVADTVSRLTMLLPDTAWITELHVQGPTIQVVGFARDAAALIKLIDRSPDFANPRFESPITVGQTPDTQRFALSMAVKYGSSR